MMRNLDGWSKTKIKDLFSTSVPGEWGADGNEDNGIPVLRSTNFCNSGEIDYSDLSYRKVNPKKLLENRLIDSGTILIEKSGGSPSQPAGRVVYCDKDFNGTASNFIEIIKVKEEFVPHFIAYLLYHNYKKGVVLKYQQQTTGIINFKLNEYVEEEIDYPESLTEQSKIAEVLETVDKAINHTEAIIAKHERIKTGLMQDLLTKGIDENGNIRSEEVHEFKDSILGRIPVDWDVFRIEECCNVLNNLRKPISSLVRESMKGDYPYYGATGILDFINEYRIDGKFVLIGEDGDHFLKFKTQEMTILINGKCNVNNHAHIIQGKDSVLTEWIHLFFLHRDITFHLTRQGAGRFKLNKASLLNLPVLVPKDKSEQMRIIKVINEFRYNQKVYNQDLDKLKQIRTALMQDLLTGKKRVTSLL